MTENVDNIINSLPSPLLESLDRCAARASRPRTDVVSEALAEWIERDEWKHGATLQALADVDAERVVSHERVVTWLRSLSTDEPIPMPHP